MDTENDPERSAPEPTDDNSAIPTGRARDEHRARRADRKPGEDAVERILAEYHARFRRIVAHYARQFGLDRDDLGQQAMLRLLSQSSVNPDDPRLLGWIAVCVRYSALDMVERAKRRPQISRDEIPDLPAEVVEPTERFTEWLDSLCDGLSVDQTRVVAMIVLLPDLSAREIGEQIGTNENNARQLKARALKKIRLKLGLTENELAVVGRSRAGQSVAEIAAELGLAEAEVDDLRRSGTEKALRAFDG